MSYSMLYSTVQIRRSRHVRWSNWWRARADVPVSCSNRILYDIQTQSLHLSTGTSLKWLGYDQICVQVPVDATMFKWMRLPGHTKRIAPTTGLVMRQEALLVSIGSCEVFKDCLNNHEIWQVFTFKNQTWVIVDGQMWSSPPHGTVSTCCLRGRWCQRQHQHQ